MENRSKKISPKILISIMVFFVMLSGAKAVQAAKIHLNGIKISQVAVDAPGAGDPLLVINNSDLSQAAVHDGGGVAQDYCYNSNNATWEIRLNPNDPLFREALALAMVAHLTGKRFGLSADDATCYVNSFAVR